MKTVYILGAGVDCSSRASARRRSCCGNYDAFVKGDGAAISRALKLTSWVGVVGFASVSRST